MLKEIAEHHLSSFLCVGIWCLLLSGCGDDVRRPSAQQLAEFQATEPAGPSIDMERVLQARVTRGPYRTIIGDVLRVELPRTVNPELAISYNAGSKEAHDCRIGDSGMIVLPVIGAFAAAGKTLAEIESGLLDAYYPQYVESPIPIYVSVLEYNTQMVSVAGAVTQPGIYALRSDQMTLVALLMKAGGIIQQTGGSVQRGASIIRIAHADVSWNAPSAGPQTLRRDPLAQTPAAQEVPSTEGASGPSDLVACRLVFEREGPLRTTGWLAVMDRDCIRLRRQIDIESEFQRSAFLRDATAAGGRTPVASMDKKLVQLASVLYSTPLERSVDVATPGSSWNVGEGGRLIACLDTPVSDTQTASKEVAPPARFAGLVYPEPVKTLALPVKGLNIPFADVALDEGDSVVVEPAREQFVSVLGLVTRPGNYPYPSDAQYNLAQAIAFAGGLDMVADPRYVGIYRLKADGSISSVTVQLVNPKKKHALTEALAMPIRPGDVVSVEQTSRTRTNVFLDRVFRVSLGVYLNPDTIWNND
jgi:protein involved in polysaccharide export with SLBB domain